jgi:hypothetical protein
MKSNGVGSSLIYKYRIGLKNKHDGDTLAREYLSGKYHCTIDLLFDWFRLVCFANKNKNCQLSYS